MNILILNGSPKGKNSTTIQTLRYIEKRFPNHNYQTLNVGVQYRKLEKNFEEAKNLLLWAELIIFAYPVYTFIAPFQLHRFIELMKAADLDLHDKFATQISTSKHFYDVTAHKFIEENCLDMNLKYLDGLSADMNDIMHKKGRTQADHFFLKLLFDIQNNYYKTSFRETSKKEKVPYKAKLTPVTKTSNKRIVIVTNALSSDVNLLQMVDDFTQATIHQVHLFNVREFAFVGGCIGCLACAYDGTCIYKDGFAEKLRNELHTADAIIYAFTIENHFTHSSMKCFDDRQFCNGHRSLTPGMPIGYIISGDYSNEYNLQTIVEARNEIAHTYLSHIATDEGDTTASLQSLIRNLEYCLQYPMDKPSNFYQVGGSKIFRDLVYMMRGVMRADHNHYKNHGVYDFPHNKKSEMFKMHLAGFLLHFPPLKKRMKGSMNDYVLIPYHKVIDSTLPYETKEI